MSIPTEPGWYRVRLDNRWTIIKLIFTVPHNMPWILRAGNNEVRHALDVLEWGARIPMPDDPMEIEFYIEPWDDDRDDWRAEVRIGSAPAMDCWGPTISAAFWGAFRRALGPEFVARGVVLS